MRTKLYVLGAVLGVAPGLLPVVSTLWVPPSQESKQSSRKGRGGSRLEPGPESHRPGVAAPPGGGAAAPGESMHPCELVTFMQVPCDESTPVCEYTYWECPRAVKPLRA